MTDHNATPARHPVPARLDHSETTNEIERSIDGLSPDTSLLTRLRLQSVRGKLARDLAHTALVEHMHERRETLRYQARIIGDRRARRHDGARGVPTAGRIRARNGRTH